MVVRGRANTGVGSSARWCSVAVRGGGARFSSSVPRWTCVPCPVSRVPRVPVCFVFFPGFRLVWFVVGLHRRAVPCLISCLAAPRRAQFVVFLLVIFSSCFVAPFFLVLFLLFFLFFFLFPPFVLILSLKLQVALFPPLYFM